MHPDELRPELWHGIEPICTDEVNLDSNWERIQINLLVESTQRLMQERKNRRFFAGGDMFVYYCIEQVESVARDRRNYPMHFRGPDFFFVDRVEPGDRDSWIVPRERGRYPDLIVEFLSPGTARVDKGKKKEIYEQIFETPEYFWFDRRSSELVGWRLLDGRDHQIQSEREGRLWSRVLRAWIGRRRAESVRVDAVWTRLYRDDGSLVESYEECTEQERERAEVAEERASTERERAEVAEARADEERRRAEAAEAELARLREQLEGRSSEG